MAIHVDDVQLLQKSTSTCMEKNNQTISRLHMKYTHDVAL